MRRIDLMRRWNFLSDWLKPVQKRLALAIAEVDVNGERLFEGIRVELVKNRENEDNARSNLKGIRGALVLLVLVARVDLTAFEFVLEEYCGLPIRLHRKETESDRFRQARFVLAMSDADGSDNIIKDFFLKTDDLRSTEFAAVAMRIANRSTRDTPKVSGVKIPLELAVSVDSANLGPRLESTFAALHSLQIIHGGWDFTVQLNAELQCTFAVESMSLDCGGVELTAEGASVLSKALRQDLGLLFSRLTLRPLFQGNLSNANAGNDAVMFGRLYETLFRATGSSAHLPKEIAIICCVSNPVYMGQLCSALAEARKISKLTLTLAVDDVFDEGDDDRMWAYLAFALFSDYSREYSSIKNLTITSAFIGPSCLESAKRLLALSDPISELFSQLERSDNVSEPLRSQAYQSRSRRAMLKSGVRVKVLEMDPTVPVTSDPASGCFNIELDTVISVLAASDIEGDGTKARVVVPGYGLCEVALDKLTMIESEDVETSPRKVTSASTRLRINFEELYSASRGLPTFIEVIGPHLISLHLEVGPIPLDIDHLMRHCFNLETLVISGTEIEAQAFLAAYRTHNMHIAELDCAFDEFSAVAKALGKPNTLFARNIRRVVYQGHGRQSRRHFEERQAIESMLSRNRTLECLEIKVHRSEYADSADYWRQDDLKPLDGVYKSLSMSCRLAFLSVLQSSLRISDEQNAKRMKSSAIVIKSRFVSMEQHVILLIFAFAAEHAYRRVYISLCS